MEIELRHQWGFKWSPDRWETFERRVVSELPEKRRDASLHAPMTQTLSLSLPPEDSWTLCIWIDD
jgi:hypothetical protein